MKALPGLHIASDMSAIHSTVSLYSWTHKGLRKKMTRHPSLGEMKEYSTFYYEGYGEGRTVGNILLYPVKTLNRGLGGRVSG